MKKQLGGIGVICLLVMATLVVNAQSGNSALVVSKDVQRVANKKAFDKSGIQAQSLAFPALVISKGIIHSDVSQPQGNIVSEGYPTWAISKGVARQNQLRAKESMPVEKREEAVQNGEELTKR